MKLAAVCVGVFRRDPADGTIRVICNVHEFEGPRRKDIWEADLDLKDHQKDVTGGKSGFSVTITKEPM